MRPFLTALLLAASALLGLTATANAATIGMGDQNPRIFSDSRFTDLKKVKHVRYIAPWDVQFDETQKARAEQWLAAAAAKKYKVHFTFNYSLASPEELPSVKEYTAATKAFVAAHKKSVESWGVWNEANLGTKKGRFAQPSAKRAAQYFTAFRTKVCKGCKVVGLDLLDGNNPAGTVRYVKSFKRALKVQPKIWGLHNYSDTNRNSMKRTAAVLKAIGGSGKVWVTETGGLYEFGKNFKASEKRQTKATNNVFAIAKKYKRIERVYFYNFYGPGADHPSDVFDAGLISGVTDTPRPAYEAFKKKTR